MLAMEQKLTNVLYNQLFVHGWDNYNDTFKVSNGFDGEASCANSPDQLGTVCAESGLAQSQQPSGEATTTTEISPTTESV